MVRLINKRNLGTVLLAGMLAGCATIKKEEIVQQAVPQPTIAVSQPNLETQIQLQPFSSFNPPNAENLISLDQALTKYVVEGLDVDEKEIASKRVIKDYFAFENKIYAVAGQLGYTEEKVKTLTPKEALELTARIVAHEMNYFATSKDFESRQAEEEQRKKLQSIFTKAKTPSGIQLLENIAKKQAEIKAMEETLNLFAGPITYDVGFDSTVAPSELFLQQQPVVCRQYAAIARDIFFVLKQRNPRLVNTYVSEYAHKSHVWNQATTLYQDQGKQGINITFFDSTWYDSTGNMEGYDLAHFDNKLLLTSQVLRFTNAAQPKKEEPVAIKPN
ncbi:MAG: hypothetical protein Q8L34_00040 [Candidatus Woesearchaeota archaeon]|nr:hypothetical protein [Candidatus Woesearchaeota archaeon]